METIGEYEYSKKDLIGHGAFAVVFKGHVKKKPNSVVAIKCITKKNLAKSAALLSKEIRILKELSGLHHDNVVGLMDCKETPHHVFLVMEYCNGGDLADYLQVKGTLSEDTISTFLKHIAAALKALNSKGVVHRDLKPQNILLCHSGRVNPPASEITLKIADFGFARFLQDGVMAATLCGSPMYMAPEVIMSLQYDAKADLWSVGTIVYQCLTGKAPFQAQTPQQLKQFYERNANLAPNIPAGTSPDLKDLLLRLLKRNAKDRIQFEAFFHHPFFNPRPVQKSAPVPVPRTRSKGSISSDSPRMQAISASPLSGATAPSPPPGVSGGMAVSPPTGVRSRTRRSSQVSEPMDTGSGSNQGDSTASGDVTMATEQEGFVLVPENIPSDHSGVSPKVDLNAIFSDDSPDNTRYPPRPQHSPARNPSPGARGPSPSEELQGGSPSRPSSFPVEIPVAHRPSSEPIPVPTQRKNYEIIQRSIGQSPSPGNTAYPPVSPRKNSVGSSGSGVRPVSPHLSSKGSSSSLASSPPGVQFCVGTPPSQQNQVQMRRNSGPVQYGVSPGRQAAEPLPPRAATYSNFQNTPALATIRGSPTRAGECFPPTREEFTDMGREESAFGPLRRTRTHTCPDNMATYHVDAANNSLVPIGRGQTPAFAMETRQTGSRRLSEQLIRAAFGAQLPSPPTTGLAAQLTNQSPPLSSVLVNYGVTGSPLQRMPSNTTVSRVRRISSDTEPPPTIAESSPNMEGPVSFVAPDLAEDTLLDSVHKDTVNKINFVLALVECIIEIANMKSSVLSDSMVMAVGIDNNHGNDNNPDQNRIEELLLMVRALQLLGATIQLAKEEVQAKRMQPSPTVKTILTEMTGHYHKCLLRCKELHKMGVTDNANMSASVMTNTADRIIYTYAIDMCQTAALDELFGNPKECFHHYRNAHILLHSLAEKAQDEKDKELLSRYRESVEKRIMALHNAGLIDCIQPTKPSQTTNTT